MLSFLYIVIAVGLISGGAEVLVRSSSRLALLAGLSPLFIGLTIVGFGTSSPELATSVTATLGSLNDVSVGNVIGSNIFNIAIILALTALITPIKVHFHALRSEMWIVIAASLLPFCAYLTGGVLPRWLGVVMVTGLFGFILRAYFAARGAGSEGEMSEVEITESLLISKASGSRHFSILKDVALVILGLGLLIAGSKMFVSNAVLLARSFGISELVIGLTIVSAGTSLPELVTSVVAALKKHTDIAVGNIVGSNIFNLLGILGVCSIVSPQSVNKQVLFLDAPLMLLVTVALVPIMKSGGVISRVEGGVLLVGYAAYLGVLLFVLGA